MLLSASGGLVAVVLGTPSGAGFRQSRPRAKPKSNCPTAKRWSGARRSCSSRATRRKLTWTMPGLELSHYEDHLRSLRQRGEQLRRQASDLAAKTASDPRVDAAELEKMREKIRLAQQALVDAQRNAKNKPCKYSVVPYEGPFRTNRRPVYLECRKDAIVLQPEGIEFGESDFEGPMGPSNPLAAGMRAVREYLANLQSDSIDKQEPYPLLIVRPDAIDAYYMAQVALQSWGSQFGYELVGADWQLDFNQPDPRMAEIVREVVAQARAEQQALIAAAPKEYHKPRQAFHVKQRGGGIEPDGGSPSARGRGGPNPYRNLATAGRSGRGGGGPGGSGSGSGNGNDPTGTAGQGGGAGMGGPLANRAPASNALAGGPGGSGPGGSGLGGGGLGGNGGSGFGPGGNGAGGSPAFNTLAGGPGGNGAGGNGLGGNGNGGYGPGGNSPGANGLGGNSAGGSPAFNTLAGGPGGGGAGGNSFGGNAPGSNGFGGNGSGGAGSAYNSLAGGPGGGIGGGGAGNGSYVGGQGAGSALGAAGSAGGNGALTGGGSGVGGPTGARRRRQATARCPAGRAAAERQPMPACFRVGKPAPAARWAAAQGSGYGTGATTGSGPGGQAGSGGAGGGERQQFSSRHRPGRQRRRQRRPRQRRHGQRRKQRRYRQRFGNRRDRQRNCHRLVGRASAGGASNPAARGNATAGAKPTGNGNGQAGDNPGTGDGTSDGVGDADGASGPAGASGPTGAGGTPGGGGPGAGGSMGGGAGGNGIGSGGASGNAPGSGTDTGPAANGTGLVLGNPNSNLRGTQGGQSVQVPQSPASLRTGGSGNSAQPNYSSSSNGSPGSSGSSGGSSSGGQQNSGGQPSSGSQQSSGVQQGSSGSNDPFQQPQQQQIGMPSFNFQKSNDQSQPPKRQSLAKSRGRDWALPDASASSVAVSRPVVVECHQDRLLILSDDGKSVVKEIRLGPQTADAVDELRTAMWDHMKTWGSAGRGFYWRPSLSARVSADGRARFGELQGLLVDSGLELTESTRPTPTAKAPPKKKGWFW